MNITIKPNYDSMCRIVAWILFSILALFAIFIIGDIQVAGNTKQMQVISREGRLGGNR